jgi:DNA-binding CsgD family transcriptional regulator
MNQPVKFNSREIEMIRLLAAGKRNKDIAAEFHVSKPSVHKWLQQARAYANVQTDTQLVALAIREGAVR